MIFINDAFAAIHAARSSRAEAAPFEWRLRIIGE
jgi:hypothetical protein